MRTEPKAVLKRAVAILMAAAFVSTACFSSHPISTTELGRLQSGFEAEEVWVRVGGCGDEAASGERARVAQAGGEWDVSEPTVPVDGRDPVTGCEMVRVSPGSPIEVQTTGGDTHRVTPFNFTLSETQLVSPDYDLLLSREQLYGAEVETFSTGKTIGVIVGLTAAAVGTFLAISLTGGDSRGLGGRQ